MTDTQDFHEDYSRHQPAAVGSDRSFGLVFAVVFGLIAALQFWKSGLWLPWTGTAGAFLLVALIAPQWLAPLNRLWYRFGLLLHKIVNPIIMGLIFFVAVVPTALIMKLAGKDPLRLKLDKEAASYWIPRDPPGPAPETMRDQF